MNYATVDDMAARFTERELIELTDTENIPPSTVDTPRVLVKLGDAQAFVDGYVGQVYRLPLQGCAKPPAVPGGPTEYVAPPVLTRLVCDVARYYLHDDLAPENEVYRRYKAAVKELEAIATGTAAVSGVGSAVSGVTGPIAYALAAVIVIGFAVAAFYFIRRMKEAEA